MTAKKKKEKDNLDHVQERVTVPHLFLAFIVLICVSLFAPSFLFLYAISLLFPCFFFRMTCLFFPNLSSFVYQATRVRLHTRSRCTPASAPAMSAKARYGAHTASKTCLTDRLLGALCTRVALQLPLCYSCCTFVLLYYYAIGFCTAVLLRDWLLYCFTITRLTFALLHYYAIGFCIAVLLRYCALLLFYSPSLPLSCSPAIFWLFFSCALLCAPAAHVSSPSCRNSLRWWAPSSSRSVCLSRRLVCTFAQVARTFSPSRPVVLAPSNAYVCVRQNAEKGTDGARWRQTETHMQRS